MILDISQEVFSCRVYPGDAAPQLDRAESLDRGSLYNLSNFSMCAHNGTHVDAPFHFIPGGKTVGELGLEPFAGECFVTRHRGDVTADHARAMLDKAGGAPRLLIAGDAVVTAEAARVFAGAGLRLLGVESPTVRPFAAPMEVHLLLLGAEVALLEGLVLTDVAEGRCFLSAAPLHLGGCDGAPCRAFLMTI